MLTNPRLKSPPSSSQASTVALGSLGAGKSGTCATSTRKFNEAAGKLANTVVLCVSGDLPFAAKRFCDMEGLANVSHLSTFRNPGFMKDWGVAFAEGPLLGLTVRAVVVVDENDKVIHAEMVPEIAQEPNYDAALKALG